jgi:hypothetical protein
MTADVLLRAAAVMAAIALVAAPGLVAAAKAARQAFSRKEGRAEASPLIDDACTVVSIARRLQQAGSQKGVDTCQQLIGILLSVSEKK